MAPAVAARPWTHRIPTTMALAALIGVVAVFGGLVISWHAATAAGATIAATAIAAAGVSGVLRATLTALRRRVAPAVPVPL